MRLTPLYILLLTAGLVLAQQDVSKRKYHTLYITFSDKTIQCDVLREDPKLKPDKSRTYYWYVVNEIKQTLGGYSGKLLDGSYKVFYTNKAIREQGTFSKGLKNGEWTSWYANGKISEVSNWKNGQKSGKYILFNELGQKMVEADFKEDLLHGKMISYQGDKIISQREYKDGQEIVPKVKEEMPKTEKPPKDKKEKKPMKLFGKKDTTSTSNK